MPNFDGELSYSFQLEDRDKDGDIKEMGSSGRK
jgi:hypothetical protein